MVSWRGKIDRTAPNPLTVCRKRNFELSRKASATLKVQCWRICLTHALIDCFHTSLRIFVIFAMLSHNAFNRECSVELFLWICFVIVTPAKKRFIEFREFLVCFPRLSIFLYFSYFSTREAYRANSKLSWTFVFPGIFFSVFMKFLWSFNIFFHLLCYSHNMA